jgi:hypothetical protein
MMAFVAIMKMRRQWSEWNMIHVQIRQQSSELLGDGLYLESFRVLRIFSQLSYFSGRQCGK